MVIEIEQTMKKNVFFYSPLPPFKGGNSPSERRLGGVKILLLLVLSLSLFLMSSCKTKEVPGRRRTPRHCNTCTKWSYAPQEAIEYELLHNDEG